MSWDAEVRRRRRLGDLGMLDHGRKTLAELHDAWLETHGADLAPKTLSIYEGCWKTHIGPVLGKVKLVEITPLVVEQFARGRLAAGAGEASVEKAWLLLSSMMNRAQAWGWIGTNPVRVASRPKKRNAKREARILTPVEIEAVRSHMDRRDGMIVSVLAYAGLRPGEMLALRWGDIGEAAITVNKALSMGEVREPKTGKPRRVPVIAPLRSDLLQWKFASPKHADGDPVFPNFRGEHWSDSDWRVWSGRSLRPALDAAGIEGSVRPYDLRHSNASLLIASGLNVVETAKRLGHSPMMCLQVYAHVFDEYEGKRIDLEGEIRRARGETDGASRASA